MKFKEHDFLSKDLIEIAEKSRGRQHDMLSEYLERMPWTKLCRVEACVRTDMYWVRDHLECTARNNIDNLEKLQRYRGFFVRKLANGEPYPIWSMSISMGYDLCWLTNRMELLIVVYTSIVFYMQADRDTEHRELRALRKEVMPHEVHTT